MSEIFVRCLSTIVHGSNRYGTSPYRWLFFKKVLFALKLPKFKSSPLQNNGTGRRSFPFEMVKICGIMLIFDWPETVFLVSNQ